MIQYNGEQDELCVFEAEAVRGYDIGELTELHLKLGRGLSDMGLTGEPIISPDVRNDPMYFNARSETRSEMVALIISTKSTVSSIWCDDPTPTLKMTWKS